MKRGEIWLVNMEPAIGHEIKKVRPAVIVQNDQGLDYSWTVLVSPITSQRTDVIHPIEAFIDGLRKPSKALCNQTKCVDKKRLLRKLGKITTRKELDAALKTTFDL